MITPLPSAPLATDSQAEFDTKAFAWVSALNGFTTEANNLAADANADATAASAAAASATASYDAFDDRYLGSKSSDPSLDNDGNALLTGALYFNTASNIMKVYSGSAWLTAAANLAAPGPIGGTTPDAGTFTSVLVRPASTQDAVELIGRSGGTSSYKVSVTPTTLTASRTLTLPDASGTVLYSGGPLGTPSSGTVTNLTGTASININGTVGASSPTTGAFTTVSASGVITSTVSTGTAPLTVSSTTAVTNLNADMLDGNHGSAFLLLAGGTMTGHITGVTSGLSMSQDGGAAKGSFTCRATSTGDSNLAGLTFWNDSYAMKMGVRNDGTFGIGGWSAAAWRWYVNTTNGDMLAAGNVTAYSDPRLKRDFQKIESPFNILNAIDGGTFFWKENIEHTSGKWGKRDYGILADQVDAVMPEIVSESVEIDGEKYKTVSYEKLVPVLIEAVKLLKAEIDTLKGL